MTAVHTELQFNDCCDKQSNHWSHLSVSVPLLLHCELHGQFTVCFCSEWARPCVCICVCVRMCVCARAFVCSSVCECERARVCVYVCVCARACVCVSVFVCVSYCSETHQRILWPQRRCRGRGVGVEVGYPLMMYPLPNSKK